MVAVVARWRLCRIASAALSSSSSSSSHANHTRPHTLPSRYYSPYPEDFGECDRLYVCPYSLKYFKRRSAYLRQLSAAAQQSPPGLRIYRAPAPPLSKACNQELLPQPAHLTFYEVDGAQAKVYCQCLCLLAKLFLDHKVCGRNGGGGGAAREKGVVSRARQAVESSEGGASYLPRRAAPRRPATSPSPPLSR